MIKVPIENLEYYTEAAFAVIEEIRSPRIAFRLEKADGEDVGVGGAFVSTLTDPELPITEEKLRESVYSVLPQKEEKLVPEEPEEEK